MTAQAVRNQSGSFRLIPLVTASRRTAVPNFRHGFFIFGDPSFGFFFGIGSGNGTAVFWQLIAWRLTNVRIQLCLQQSCCVDLANI